MAYKEKLPKLKVSKVATDFWLPFDIKDKGYMIARDKKGNPYVIKGKKVINFKKFIKKHGLD